MKIYAGGEAIKMKNNEGVINTGLNRVVGVIDLDELKDFNNTGWSSVKAVVNIENEFYILDFPETVRLETNDGVLICEGGEIWWPSVENAKDFDLFVFKKFVYD